MQSAAVERRTWRDRYNAIIERHEVAWEPTFAALAVMYVVIGFTGDDAAADVQPYYFALDALITVIFAVEFTTRIAASYDRRAYMKGHWVDLLALIPVGAIRGLRIARLLRLLRLVRAFAGVNRALGHKGLVWLLVAWITVMLLMPRGCTSPRTASTRRSRARSTRCGGASPTMTTVGYGDVFPTTAEGRIAAAVLMIFGIGLYSIITATVTSFLI